MERKGFIGGSDIAVVLGLSRWKTQLQLWAEKTGKVEPADLSDNEAVEMGKDLEEFVAKKFEQRSGMKVRRDRRDFVSAEDSRMSAHIDRRITGTDAILECKTCSAWKAHEWEGEEIPQEYILQVMWYMGITGMHKGYIAVLIGGQKFLWKEVVWDADLYQQMMDKAVDFMDNYVGKDVAPMAVGGDSDTLKDLYPDASDAFVEDETFQVLLEDLEGFKLSIKSIENEKENIEAKIKQAIGENKGLTTSGYKVSWTPQTYTRVDTNKMKEEGIYDKYKTSRPTRVMRVTKRKGE